MSKPPASDSSSTGAPPPPPAGWSFYPGGQTWGWAAAVVALIVGVAGFITFVEDKVATEVRKDIPPNLTVAYFEDRIDQSVSSRFHTLEGLITQEIQNTVGQAIRSDETRRNIETDEKNTRTNLAQAQKYLAETRELLNRAQAEAEAAIQRAKDVTDVSERLRGLFNNSNFNDALQQQFRSPDFVALVAHTLVPRGGVMAFDNPGGCPSGWSAFQIAAGRVIVGAGPNNNRSASGDALIPRPFRVIGGEEKHTLTVSEMPAHNHETALAAEDAGVQYGSGTAIKSIRGVTYDPSFRGALTSTVGESSPFSVMPPFIALYFCSKD
jgi:hypothetical protein